MNADRVLNRRNEHLNSGQVNFKKLQWLRLVIKFKKIVYSMLRYAPMIMAPQKKIQKKMYRLKKMGVYETGMGKSYCLEIIGSS